MTDYSNDEGVSPVVGVILMVAVTVILAAVIGAFVLDLGGNTQENVNAGVSMDETNNGVEVQWIDRGNADQLEVLVNGSKVSGSDLTSVGDSVTVTAGADDTVSVRGTSGDTEGVIQSTTAENDTTGGSNPSVVSTNGGGGTTTNSLSGTVSYNPPAEGVTVELLDSSGTVVDSDTTASDGSYTLSDDGSGSKITVNGYGNLSTDTGDIDLNTVSNNTSKQVPTVLMEGDGTSSSPYKVDSASDLYSVREDLNAEYKMMNNIDMSHTSTWNSGNGFTPISGSFSGTFNGNGYEVQNLTIDKSGTNNVGLFADNTGTISNIGVTNVDITGGDRVGGLVGSNYGGYITGSYSTGSVDGGNEVGGLVGNNLNGGSIDTSYSTSSVNGNDKLGGLVGYNNDRIENSYSTGSVTGSTQVGGLVGDHSGNIVKSYSTGSVTGNTSVGGLIGNSNGHFTDSYWDTESSGQGSSGKTSGLTGLTTSEMSGSSAETNMSGFDFSGIWTSVSGDYPDLQ